MSLKKSKLQWQVLIDYDNYYFKTRNCQNDNTCNATSWFDLREITARYIYLTTMSSSHQNVLKLYLKKFNVFRFSECIWHWIQIWHWLWYLTAKPEEGSIKSAQKPSLCRAQQISFAPSTNCKVEEQLSLTHWGFSVFTCPCVTHGLEVKCSKPTMSTSVTEKKKRRLNYSCSF